MSKSKKIILGIATLWPIVYLVMFLIFIFSQLFISFLKKGPMLGSPFLFLIIFAVHLLTIVWIFVLIVIYMKNLFKNERVKKEEKALWAVIFFLGSIIAMPIYWYLYIWKNPETKKKKNG